MSRERIDQTLVEELEQELRQALAIEPSADFARQVRARIERPQVWRWQWPLAVAAAACVLAVGLGWRFMRDSVDPPAAPISVRVGSDVELQPAPSPIGIPRPSLPIVRNAPRNVASVEPDVRVSEPEPEVIVPADRARALARLLELARSGDLDEQKLRPVAAAAVPATLEVEPINVPLLLTPPIDTQAGTPRGGAGRE